MNDNMQSPDQEWVDPDDAPDLSTPEWTAKFDAALLSRGVPLIPEPKERIEIYLDADIIEHFRKGGPGWQSRMNEALRESMKRSS